MNEKIDWFHPARDHERGPGAWCVRSTRCEDWSIPATKPTAYLIAAVLNGNREEADTFIDMLRKAEQYASVARPRTD